MSDAPPIAMMVEHENAKRQALVVVSFIDRPYAIKEGTWLSVGNKAGRNGYLGGHIISVLFR